jgi:hypothetical protein
MRSSTRPDIVITVLFTFAILFSAVISTPVLIGAQVQSPANITSTHKMGVKIMSPSGNVTLRSGPLTIHGISSDTTTTNCKVYVDWNDLKPMQNVTAKGTGGGNDYSNWTYTYTEKYHIIAPGINELTSKITCFDNPNNITSKYYSINITGLKNNTVSPTLPSSSNITTGFHNLAYLPQYDGFYHDIFQPTVKYESLGQDSSNNNSPNDNNDESNDDGNNDGSDSTNNDNTKNDDSQSQSNNHSDDVKNDRSSSSSEANDDDNEHSKGRTHNSEDDENKEHQDKHEKKHNHNNQNKDKDSEKHKGSHSKNLKAHKQKH